jgi:hypothetical protein
LEEGEKHLSSEVHSDDLSRNARRFVHKKWASSTTKKEEIMIFSFWEIEEGVEVRVKDGNRRS